MHGIGNLLASIAASLVASVTLILLVAGSNQAHEKSFTNSRLISTFSNFIL